MTEPHKHCPACGAAIPMSESVCSPQCLQILAENQRKIKRTRTILYIVIALFVAVWIYFTLRGKYF